MAKPPQPTPVTAAATPLSRRELLVHAGEATLALCLVGGSAGALRLATPNVEAGRRQHVLLGTPADFKMGTVTWLKEHELFVLRTGDGVGVFSSRCTHLGCSVRRTGTGFRCPCHGARFDSLGRVIDGPARRPLDWFRVRIEGDGRLWADVAMPVEVGVLTRELLAAAEESR